MNKTRILGDNRGIILILTFLVIVVFSILAIGMFSRMITETKATQRYKESAEAFYLAETAIDKTIAKLPGSTASETRVALGGGEYSLDIVTITPDEKWRVVGTGYVPAEPSARFKRQLEAFLEKKKLESNFWSDAVQSAGNINLDGTSYEITGSVRYAGQLTGDPSLIPEEDRIHDDSISPLALLYFTGLRNKAIAQVKPNGQNNLYTAADIDSGKAFPTSFWFDTSDSDPKKWIPNVVYIETDLVLKGNLTAGGFIIVGGDIIENVDLGGNASIEGCVYTRGYFQNKGGGHSLNINGGIWAGDYVNLKGNPKVTHNQTYMDAIKDNIDPSTEVQMISWREVNN